MYKIAVMGDRDSVSGFASLGLEIFPEEDAERAATTLRKMISGGYAVIFMTEKLAIIPIPGVTGNTGLGLRSVSKSVEKAVGSDIIGA